MFNFEGPFEGPVVKQAAHPAGQPYDMPRAPLSVPEALGMDEGQLARFLYLRLMHVQDARRRSRWFGGRIYNRMVGAEVSHIELPGHRMLAAMRWAGVTPPKGVQGDRYYLLRLDVAAKAFAALHLWCRTNGVNYRDWDLELAGPIS